ncbi:MAG: sensor histidine kinase [Anaerolineae bacterium]|nr:sensor histidine kinase [Anaerolineae bacterium]
MTKKLAQFTWRQWLLPRPIDGIGALIYLAIWGLYGGILWNGPSVERLFWPRAGSLLGITLFLLALDRLEYLYYDSRLSRRQAGALMVGRTIAVCLALLVRERGSTGGFLFTAFAFGAFFLVGSSYRLTGVVWALALCNPPIEFSVGAILPFYTIYFVYYERRNRHRAETLLRELSESHRQLQAYAEQIAELATSKERNRLAREIHDSLGHYLSIINVQLEKAIAFRDRDPALADQAVRDAKRLAGSALQDVRRSVSALRGAPQPLALAQSLHRLVDDNVQTGQFSIDLAIEGEEKGYSQQSLLALYRAAQEGLTNIQKHAQASQVRMQLQMNTHAATLSITDNGQGFDVAGPADGYGLQGIRERLELIRGSLKLESAPGQGATLLICVPKDPLALENNRNDG